MRPIIYSPTPARPVVPLRPAIGPVYTPPRPHAPSGQLPAGGQPPAGGTPPAASPDYLALIKASPAYQSWLSSRNDRLTNLATDRATAIRQLALQYGGLPAGFTDTFGDLTPADIAAEQGNQFSVTQQLQRADAQGRQAMHRSLAARGMLQSGDLGYGETQADQALAQGNYDAATSFLSALNAALSGYTSGAGGVNAEESGIIAQLLPEIMKLYPAPAPGAETPPPGSPAAPLRPVTGPVPTPTRPTMPPLRPARPGRPTGRQQ